MSNLVVALSCRRCGGSFDVAPASYEALGLRALPKTCPTCADLIQRRPDVTLERRELFSAVATVGGSFRALVSGAQPFAGRPSDIPVWRLAVKGERYGASWAGRIDLYLHTDPAALPTAVLVSHMQTKKRVAVQPWSRATREHGVVNGYHRVPLGTVAEEGRPPVEERTETDEYVSVIAAPDGAEVAGTLVWATAWSKTTLKGFGRQYHASLEGTPLWSLSVSGQYRSSRADGHGMLAIVRAGDLYHEHREGGAVERTEVVT